MAEYIYDFKEPPDPEGYRGRLIRCKDCKYSYTDEATLICEYRGFFVNDMFYCADGERKEE